MGTAAAELCEDHLEATRACLAHEAVRGDDQSLTSTDGSERGQQQHLQQSLSSNDRSEQGHQHPHVEARRRARFMLPKPACT